MYVLETLISQWHDTWYNPPGLEVPDELTQLRIAGMHGMKYTVHTALREVPTTRGRNDQ